MISVRIIDDNGYWDTDDLGEYNDDRTLFTNLEGVTYDVKYVIEAPCPDGFYLPKWDGTSWVEGKTAEEIAAIPASATTSEPTDTERITALEATQSDVVDILASALGVTI